ncbi:hypothetical protein J1N35_023300 [Gossypium stocksii]|uniref:Uncharacterized protein n=1 Tax=Gossypium stocksii TaxID=47602 RepID=A0A9D3VK24_9ROSI|nr:hypothetical protein J1N35_023300 [Gossypium stocksii]
MHLDFIPVVYPCTLRLLGEPYPNTNIQICVEYEYVKKNKKMELHARVAISYASNSKQADLLTSELNAISEGSKSFDMLWLRKNHNDLDISGGIPLTWIPSYVASKPAVKAMTKILAKELKGTKITANCVAPGPVATKLFFAGKTEETIQRFVDVVPFVRVLVFKHSVKDDKFMPNLFFLISVGNVLVLLMLDVVREWVQQRSIEGFFSNEYSRSGS